MRTRIAMPIQCGNPMPHALAHASGRDADSGFMRRPGGTFSSALVLTSAGKDLLLGSLPLLRDRALSGWNGPGFQQKDVETKLHREISSGGGFQVMPTRF